jgi:hypothetical protein
MLFWHLRRSSRTGMTLLFPTKSVLIIFYTIQGGRRKCWLVQHYNINPDMIWQGDMQHDINVQSNTLTITKGSANRAKLGGLISIKE